MILIFMPIVTKAGGLIPTDFNGFAVTSNGVVVVGDDTAVTGFKDNEKVFSFPLPLKTDYALSVNQDDNIVIYTKNARFVFSQDGTALTFSKKNASDKQVMWASRIAVIVIAVLGEGIAWNEESIIFNLVSFMALSLLSGSTKHHQRHKNKGAYMRICHSCASGTAPIRSFAASLVCFIVCNFSRVYLAILCVRHKKRGAFQLLWFPARKNSTRTRQELDKSSTKIYWVKIPELFSGSNS